MIDPGSARLCAPHAFLSYEVANMSPATGRFRYISVVVATVCLAGVPATHAQTLLRYKFKESEKLQYALEQKMAMTMNVAGNNIEVSMNQSMDWSWNIKSVDKDGKAKVSMRFDRARMSMEGPMGKIEFDTKDDKVPEGPIGEMLATPLKALVGGDIELSVDARGRVSDLKLPQKMLDTFKNQGDQFGGMGGAFSEDTVKQMMEQGSTVLPEGSVRKGDSWNQKLDMKMKGMGTIKMDNTMTYQGETTRGGHKLEEISFKPKMTLEPAADAPVSVKVKNWNAEGSSLFDNTVGRVDQTNMKQTMDMEVTAMGMEFTQKIEQTVTMKLHAPTK
jgi:hypothetical protein